MIAKLEQEIRAAYPEGLTWQKTIPTFHPENSEQASDIIRRCGKHGQKVFIAGFGNSIDPVGDPFAALLVIKSDRLNYLKNVAAADFYITVGAGYPLKEINHVIADKNLWLPFADTNYPGSAGGAVASGLAGNDGDHIVPLSRYLLSLTAVLPDGSIVHPGANTFKSVAGYDISRIFFNSWGMMGMVIEMTFRVLPASKRSQTPHIALLPSNRDNIGRQMRESTPLGEMCRKLRDEFDPHRLLADH
jgi:FAD/FMN-containing dehydrogenase